MKFCVFICLAVFALFTSSGALVHRYSFNEPAGALKVKDLKGTADGDLKGTAFVNGEGLMELTGPDAYCDLPNGIISKLSNATFEMWFTMESFSGLYHRFFDFGNSASGENVQGPSATTFVGFMPKSPEFNTPMYFCVGGANGQDGARADPVELGVKTHVAVTYDYANNICTIYVNGRKTGTGAAKIPLATINDVNNWLGRSNWTLEEDFTGSYDEFRIYDHALSDMEVARSFAEGPNGGMVPGIDPAWGNLLSLELIGDFKGPRTYARTATPFRLFANFANQKGVDITRATEVTYTPSIAALLDVIPGAVGSKLPGRSFLSASFRGLTVQVPVIFSLPMQNRYSFTETLDGSSTPDLFSERHGLLSNPQAMRGGRLHMTNSATFPSFVTLPMDQWPALKSVSLEFWTTHDQGGPTEWQRVYDFGKSPGVVAGFNIETDFLFSPLGGLRRASTVLNRVTVNGAVYHYAELDGTTALVPTRETHVVMIYNPSAKTTKLYINGALDASGNAAGPMSHFKFEQGYIGRSIWEPGLSYYSGSFDEFRIYGDSLTDADIARSFADGPNHDGSLVDLLLESSNQYLKVGEALPVIAKAHYLRRMKDITSQGVTYTTSDTQVATVSSTGIITGLKPGKVTIQAVFETLSAKTEIQVYEETPAELLHRYTFNEASGSLEARDSVGNMHGVLQGTSDEIQLNGAGAILFDGNAGHVDLPNHLLGGLTGQATFEFWTTPRSPQVADAPLFDFGSNASGEDSAGLDAIGISYIPTTSDFSSTFLLSRNGKPPFSASAMALMADQKSHVIITYDLYKGKVQIFVDGILQSDTDGSLAPLHELTAINNWLGRSNRGNSIYAGSLDEFSIYRGLLTPEQIAANNAAGPVPATSPVLRILSIVKTGSNLTLFAETTGSSAAGHRTEAANDVKGPWRAIPSTIGLNGNQLTVDFPAPGITEFYRVVYQ